MDDMRATLELIELFEKLITTAKEIHIEASTPDRDLAYTSRVSDEMFDAVIGQHATLRINLYHDKGMVLRLEMSAKVEPHETSKS